MAAPDLSLLERMLADQRKQNAELKRLLEGGGDPPHDGGMDPWQQTVETRLGELRNDMRGLRSDMDRDFRWTWAGLVAGFVGMAALMAKGFGWL